MIDNQLFKKVHGCNVGGYVGAALGEPSRRCGGGVFDCYNGLCGPIEAAHYKVIDEVLGKPVDKMLPQVKAWVGGEVPNISYEAQGWKTLRWHNGPLFTLPALNYPPGTNEDGGERKWLVMKAIFDKGGRITKEDLRNSWLTYVNPDWFGFHLLPRDKCTYENMKRFPASEVGKYDRWPGNVDCLMMIHPVGIINACDPQRAAEDSLDMCQTIQSSLLSYAPDAAAAIAAGIAEAFKHEATVDSIIQAAKAYVDENIGQIIDECLEYARQAPDILEVRELFWKRFGGRVPTDSLEVVGESFAMFWITKGDPKQCMIAGSSLGRDADCVASIAGAIAGAFKGIDAIPKDWVEICDKATMDDTHELIDMNFEEQSRALYDVLLKIMDRQKEQVRAIESLMK
ncbi:MAG: ADP-ribosylglycohydrolase family protein [Deltaproteobacteria bacterium]|nr:ADP-ribosylglycohydrolase family protein [Deltaproteobacteria bacterium]MBW2307096.1 ADP-ribosylglycohydrolase family protein [Deltaproteobacteria bacterium]